MESQVHLEAYVKATNQRLSLKLGGKEAKNAVAQISQYCQEGAPLKIETPEVVIWLSGSVKWDSEGEKAEYARINKFHVLTQEELGNKLNHQNETTNTQ